MKRLDLAILVWGAVTAFGLLVPPSTLSSASVFPNWLPAAAHFVLFLVMVVLVGRRLYAIGSPWPPALAVVIAFLYGFVLELAQTAVEGRFFEWQDLVMNGFGCLVAAAVIGLVGRRGRAD